jgi:hypothetical protein
MLGMVRDVLPLALRAAAETTPNWAATLLDAAERCAAASDLTEALEATKASMYGVTAATWRTTKAAVWAADLALLAAKEAAWTGQRRRGGIARDDILKAAVDVALRAYEQTS